MHKINDRLVTFLDPATIEPQALVQLETLAKMPFIFKHVAAMPDCHLGKGATVGSVIATKGAIIPAAVGVDIGCGMIAVQTTFKAEQLPDNVDGVRKGIERRVPLGSGGRNQKLSGSATDRVNNLIMAQPPTKDYAKVSDWSHQLGSLGSGNHFIEICLDENDTVWAVVHSGSRGVGNRLASEHIKTAQKIMGQFFIELPDKDLAYLPEHTPEFVSYIQDLLWCQDFALANREEMMDRVLTELSFLFFHEGGHQGEIESQRINCHHNFSQQEHHMGQNVWVTRKGAIQMREGQYGVIPGSMGTSSYIVSGLENVPSFHSAPHGAGRRFSRTEARRRFTMDDLKTQMGDVSYRHEEALLDEIPGAYKDIDVVMENSKELVRIHHTLKQILNVKGN